MIKGFVLTFPLFFHDFDLLILFTGNSAIWHWLGFSDEGGENDNHFPYAEVGLSLVYETGSCA
jgi:hypothetical protein